MSADHATSDESVAAMWRIVDAAGTAVMDFAHMTEADARRTVAFWNEFPEKEAGPFRVQRADPPQWGDA